jgi:hypothetical protein
MALGRPLLHVLLVDLDAQPWAARDLHEAVGVVEDLGIADVVEQVVALVVLDAKTLLLDEGVVAVGIELQAHG